MKTKSGVLVFAFGLPFTTAPNRRIAAAAATKARAAQGVICSQIRAAFACLPVTYLDDLLPPDSGTPSTMAVAYAGVRWAKEHGITELWIAAAGPHLRRARRDVIYAARQLGHRVGIRVCPGLEQPSLNIWFSPDSNQPHTRSPLRWRIREAIVSHLPMSLYERVAA